MEIKGKAVVLTNGILDTPFAKTCHGLLRGSERFEVVAVIDHKWAGKDAGEVLDGKPRKIPVLASVQDFFNSGIPKPDYCIIGVALPGGYLPDSFREQIISAIGHGLNMVNGLHTYLSEDPEFSVLAQKQGVQLIDIRRPKPAKDLNFWKGEIYKVKAQRIAVLGMDCALGKRTTCRFLMETCRAGGIKAEMIYTGQTGWMQGYPYGFIFDSTLNDFVSGEIEKAIVSCDRDLSPDLILVEGQSALRNPSGPCGSEFLLSGNIKAVVLQHAPGRHFFEDQEELENVIPPVENEIALIRYYGARVLAVTLNEENMQEEDMSRYQQILKDRLGIPVIRPLKEGLDALLPFIKDFIGGQTEEPKPVAKITGIGGIFFKCASPDSLKEWYQRHFGMYTDPYGAMFEFRLAGHPEKKGFLQWSTFSQDSPYMQPSAKDFMINYRVNDLQTLVDNLKQAGVNVLDNIETYEYGKFVHVLDPEGNKIELWEPVDQVFDDYSKGKTNY